MVIYTEHRSYVPESRFQTDDETSQRPLDVKRVRKWPSERMRQVPQRLGADENGDGTVFFADGAAAAVVRMMGRQRSPATHFGQRPSTRAEAHVDAGQ